jgi:hypothetical protein
MDLKERFYYDNMTVEQRVAYDLGGRYIVGKFKKHEGNAYYFTDACFVRANELPKESSLEEGLKQVYLSSNRDDKKVETSLLMTPNPRRFNIDVEK